METREKVQAGRSFLRGQVALVIALAALVIVDLRLWPTLPAFVPTLFRGFAWFLRKPEPLKIHALGWSEMRQAVAFGVLLIAGFAASLDPF